MQYEITTAMPLLNGQGNLNRAGWARKLLPVYERSKVRGGLARRKEWDYYYVGNDRFGLALTIADNSYMGMASASFLSFEGTPWQVTKSPMNLFPMGRTGLPSTSAEGVSALSGKGYALTFMVEGCCRELYAHMDNFHNGQALDAELILSNEPEESMVICIPFEKKGHFYFNQKINCLRASGRVRIGDATYTFRPGDSFGVLDWGRGVWTYHNTWYWASASGLVHGMDFGFNLGCGFGDTSAATENVLFCQGKVHKLGNVLFRIPKGPDGREDYLKPWSFVSDDGRFKMDFDPILDRASKTDFKLLKSDQHQVFGRFTGTAVLDDGSAVAVRDLMGFAERVENKW